MHGEDNFFLSGRNTETIAKIQQIYNKMLKVFILYGYEDISRKHRTSAYFTISLGESCAPLSDPINER